MRVRFKKSRVFILLIVLVSSGSLAFAETAVLSTDYLERAPARFGYGLMNTVFGWTALGVAPYQASKEGAGAGDAFGRAITHPFAHTFLGIWDLCTFWVPGECGRSMAVPRHVWMPREKKPAQKTPQDLSSTADETAPPAV